MLRQHEGVCGNCNPALTPAVPVPHSEAGLVMAEQELGPVTLCALPMWEEVGFY